MSKDNLDLVFKFKEPIKKEINNSNEDKKTKKAMIFALDHEKFTKDVANFASEEIENPSDDKTRINKGVDIAFDNKEAVKDLINNTEDENLKKVGDIALKDKKLTKDVANFVLDEQRNPSDDKAKINKGIDIAFDNKETVKDIINTNVENEDLKKVGEIALKDKKLTKDVTNFALDEGEKINEELNEFSKKEDIKTSDYFKLASDNREQVDKALDVIFDNKKAVNDLITDKKSDAGFAINHEKFTRDVAHLAIEDGQKMADNIEEFNKKEDKKVFDYTKFMTNNNNEIYDAARVLNENPAAVSDIINTYVEDEDTREVLNFVNDNVDLEGLANFAVGCAHVVNSFEDCIIF